MPSLFLQIEQTGGFFTRINRDITDGIGTALDELGSKGEDKVRQYLDTSLVNPTGFYESQIAHYRTSPTTAVVTDSGTVYGPWLEGTGSRNAPVTSFEGYRTFQDVAMDLEDIAEQVMDKHLQETETFLQ